MFWIVFLFAWMFLSLAIIAFFNAGSIRREYRRAYIDRTYRRDDYRN